MSDSERNVGKGFSYEEPLLFERSRPGRVGYSLPELDVPAVDASAVLPENWIRTSDPDLPELSEIDVIRHFTRLSTWNAAVDLGIYPPALELGLSLLQTSSPRARHFDSLQE